MARQENMMGIGAPPDDVSDRPAWRLEDDFDFVVDSVGEGWAAMRGARVFITGGTGFVGRWLLETLSRAEQRRALDIKAMVLTRDVARFRAKAAHLADDPMFEFVAGDVTSMAPPSGEFTHIVHAATDSGTDLHISDPLKMFDTVVAGTRRVLDFAVERKVKRVLFLSSGAVYGPQPFEISHQREVWAGGPNFSDPRHAYAEGKRAAEMLCGIYARQSGIEVTTARIFALVGPFLSLDAHFAIGNFIRDAIAGKKVVVHSDGRALRSYLYAADLAAWLWSMLARAPRDSHYNVGSEEAISIRDLAARVAQVVGTGEYEVLGKPDGNWNPGRYVPSTERIRTELGLTAKVSLNDAIWRTAMWSRPR
ncbi:NAD-dependent epimerase/dehydratase family protein [Roseixanthobacter glucoisosaccharinicivorans]|uniref:NAD-dependent epimerase/dehydratase family protein n=1 Tax=Roseixanthobacter glucoisosaccharinicivorans TaxID=3119923 RepID=UPI0037279F52